MQDTNQLQDIDKYMDLMCEFNDYSKFDGDKDRRDAERDAFINNLEYTPNYDYPRLDFLIDNEKMSTLKRRIYESVIELEKAEKENKSNSDELTLYSKYHESRLKRIMLVESARSLRNSTSASDVDINRLCFNKLNIANYGELDTELYLGLLSSEISKVRYSNTLNETTETIRNEIISLIGDIDTRGIFEKPLIDNSVMTRLSEYVTDRYRHIFHAVPFTDENVYYEVDDCVDIINKALEYGGLADFGWKVIKDSTKTNPTTSSTKNTIYLPTSTRRNASELCRLIIHEQEVHARRAQNSRKYNIKPLEFGTANYADIEEGLAVILECAVTGSSNNSSFRRARNRYLTAGLALGADGRPRDARETFEIMWRLIALQKSQNLELSNADIDESKNQAYTHIENAYRGTQFWMKGVIYTKLKVYYEGLIKNAKYISNNIDNLDEAFRLAMLGKYDHTDASETRLVLTILEKSVNITQPE